MGRACAECGSMESFRSPSNLQSGDSKESSYTHVDILFGGANQLARGECAPGRTDKHFGSLNDDFTLS